MCSKFAWVKGSTCLSVLIVRLGVQDISINSEVWYSVVFGEVISLWWMLVLGATWAVADWITSHLHIGFSLSKSNMRIIFDLITWIFNETSLNECFLFFFLFIVINSFEVSVLSFLEFHHFSWMGSIEFDSHNMWDWWWQWDLSANIVWKSVVNSVGTVLPWRGGFMSTSFIRVTSWDWIQL